MTRLKRFSLIMIALIIIILPQYCTYSYCVYNKMDNGNELYVYQVSGQRAVAHNPKRRFNHHMPAGNKECCPYVNTDCSMKADKNYSVMLVLSFSRNGDQRKYGETTVKVPCPAGGYVVAKGTIDQFSYEVYDADHNHIEVPIR